MLHCPTLEWRRWRSYPLTSRFIQLFLTFVGISVIVRMITVTSMVKGLRIAVCS